MKRIFIVAGLLMGLVLSVPSLSHASDDGSIQVERISGVNRYVTAVEISKYTFRSSMTAIIATGENFPDALAGGTLATQIKAPILLTQKNNVPSTVINELKRLNVRTVYILGGEAAVSRKVENELSKLTKVRRIAGKDRYETAHEIGSLRYDLRPNQEINAMGDGIVFVSGNNFPDALCAAPYIGQQGGDMLLYLLLLRPGEDAAPFPVIGGPGVIKNTAEFDREPHIEEDGSLYEHRIYGKNRYGTAVEIAKRYPINVKKRIDTIILTNGLDYPDALSAAPLVGALNGALLLTNPQKLSEETKQYLKENDIERVIVVGGKNAVSGNVIQEIEQIERIHK